MEIIQPTIKFYYMESFTSPLHIGIIDDDTDFVHTFGQLIKKQQPGFSYTPVGNSLTEVFLMKSATIQKFDIIFLDILMPGISGINGIAQLKVKYPMSKIVMLTVVEDEESLMKALCSGADGYLLKGFTEEEFIYHLQTISQGGAILSSRMARYIISYFGPKLRHDDSFLTEKNLQVLHLLAEGWAYKTIADRMNISIDGVRYHIKEIYRAMGVQSVAQAVRKYVDGDLPTK